MAITTKRTWLPQWTSLIRQFGEGGKELAVGAGAEATGAAGAVEAGVRDGAWVNVAVAWTGVKVGAGEEGGAGVETGQELLLDPVVSLSQASSGEILGR